jgi:hypothetical protein
MTSLQAVSVVIVLLKFNFHTFDRRNYIYLGVLRALIGKLSR